MVFMVSDVIEDAFWNKIDFSLW